MRSKSAKRNYTSARDRAQKQSQGYEATYLKVPEGMTMFKPKAGTMLLDILPFIAGGGNPWAEEGAIHWERTIHVHRGIGANEDTYICPRMTSKKRCPVCEDRARLAKTAEDEDEEQLVKDLAPKQRNLYIIKNLKEPDKGLDGMQLWDISYHLFGKVLDARLRSADEDDEWDKFFYLEEGLSLRVGFAEKSFAGHTFLETESIDFKPRKEQYDEEQLNASPCLDDIVVELTYDELRKIYLLKSDDDDDEEDDKPAKAGKKASSKRPAKELDDEDDDEEEELDEEDEEEEEVKKPLKKSTDSKASKGSSPSSKKRSEPEEEPDEDDEEIDEEEEDESEGDEEDDSEGEDEDEDEEEEERPRIKTKDEEDEELEDEDDDEEEVKKPAKKPVKPSGKPSAPPVKSKKASKDEEEDEDWDDFEDDEEEEEKPVKKKK
jgi:hypothetical protein